MLEDVQWIDPATRDVVTFLAHNLRSERLVSVLTFRSEHLPRRDPLVAWLSDLRRATLVRSVTLRPLSADETREQIAAILGAGAADEIAGRVHRRSEGNPLFTEELLSAIRAGSEALPDGLSEALLATVGRLSPATRLPLSLAAVTARPVDERFFAAVLGGSEEDYLEPIREAVVAQVLIAGPDAYRFRHGLFAEAIAADLTPGERRGLHARIAAALEADPSLAEAGEAWADGEVADHWLAAGRPAEAYGRAIRAAQAASGIHADAIAFARWEQALALADRVEAPRRAEILERLGLDEPTILLRAAQAGSLSEAHERALALVERARAGIDPAITPSAAGVLASEHGRILWNAGRFGAAQAVMREAMTLMASDEGGPNWARVASRFATLLLFGDQASESVGLARGAAQAGRMAGLRDVEAQALDALGNGLWVLGATSEAVEALTEARRAAQDSGSVEEAFFASDSLAECLVDADRFAEALDIADTAEAEAQRSGLARLYGAMFRGNAGMALFVMGRWPEAEVRTVDGIDTGHGRVWALSVRARLMAATGRVAEGRRAVQTVQGMFPEGLPDIALLECALPSAELDLAEGRPDAALETIEGALGAGGRHVGLRLSLAAAGLRAAADVAAGARARRDEPAVGRAIGAGARLIAEVGAQREILGGWDPPTPSKLATAALAEAEAARLEGRPDSATWAAVASAFDAVPMPYPATYARYRQAEAQLQAEGVRASGAGALLNAAHVQCLALGAAPLAADIERLARHARVTLAGPFAASTAALASLPTEPTRRTETTRQAVPARPARSVPPGQPRLSARERQVLALVAAGRTNGQIASELFISLKTASVHVTHILNKLGASNRVEAALMASRAGLLDEVGPSGNG